MSKYTVDVVRQVWNNKTGERVDVGPDRDGLDLVEVSHQAGGAVSDSLTLTPEHAKLVAAAMLACAGELEAKEQK